MTAIAMPNIERPTRRDTVVVDRDVLLDALTRVSLVVRRGESLIPVLKAVRIAADGDGLQFTGTDFDRTVSLTIPANDASAIATRVVPCHRLLAIVSQLPSGPVAIAATESQALRLTAGRARFDVTGIAPDEFPSNTNPSHGETISLTMDAPALIAALTRCATHASPAESRPALMGVHVSGAANGRLCLEASDSSVLVREWVERETGPAIDVVVPVTSVAAIAKLFANADRLAIELRGGRAVILADATRFDTGLIDSPFPRTAQFFALQHPLHATIDGAAFLSAVKRVAAVSSNIMLLIRTEWHADHVVVSGVGDTDAGTSEDVVPCEFSGEAPFRICFGDRLLVRAVSLRTSGALDIGFKNAETVITLRDSDSPEIQGVVFPRRDLGR